MSHPVAFTRATATPYITQKVGTLAPDAVTTPDLLEIAGGYILLVGAVSGGTERLISLALDKEDLFQDSITEKLDQAKLALQPGPADHDLYHVFDPATVSVNGRNYLYYSAIGKGSDSIGLAISTPNDQYEKRQNSLITGRSPEIVLTPDGFFLYYVLPVQNSSYRIFAAKSSDGINFRPVLEDPVLDVGKPGSWDSFEVTTPRIFQHQGIYYMVYGGCASPERKDMPDGFGLARSTDLIHWERYPQNPIFTIGETGQWDDGAIWFGTVHKIGEKIMLFYEGGRMSNIIDMTPARTQVGKAEMSESDFNRLVAKW